MEVNKLKHHFSNTINELATFISEAVSEKVLAELSLLDKTLSGKNGQIDHLIPVQSDHQFRMKLTT